LRSAIVPGAPIARLYGVTDKTRIFCTEDTQPATASILSRVEEQQAGERDRGAVTMLSIVCREVFKGYGFTLPQRQGRTEDING
jgi:hypothetical protein